MFKFWDSVGILPQLVHHWDKVQNSRTVGNYVYYMYVDDLALTNQPCMHMSPFTWKEHGHNINLDSIYQNQVQIATAKITQAGLYHNIYASPVCIWDSIPI